MGSGYEHDSLELDVKAPLLPREEGFHDDSSSPSSASTSSSRSPSPDRRRRRSQSPPHSHQAHVNTLRRIFGYAFSLLGSKHSLASHRTPTRRSARKRAFQYCVLIIATPLVLLVCAVIWWGGVPHSYGDVRRYEDNMPQHRWKEVKVDLNGELLESDGRRVNISEDAGEGYLRFPNHLWGHGFNNVLEESLLTAYLAYRSDRAYVFEDYVWSHVPWLYTLYDFGLRPTRVPLNAFLSGFIAGANVTTSSILTGPPVHLSISANYYNHICPPNLPQEHRVVLSADDAPNFPDGITQIDWWVDRVKTLGKGKRCVEITEGDTSGNNGKRLFDFGFFGSRNHIAPIVPGLLSSPVLKHFEWSQVVNSAVDKTLGVLGLASLPELESDSGLNNNTTIPGLLAIHLRRGDYSRHCVRLATWRSGYFGFNLAEEMTDRLDLDEAGKEDEVGGQDESERRERTLERRWYYWAGRAGQRLSTSSDVGALSPSPARTLPGSRYGVRPPDYEPSSSSGTKTRWKKEDFDYARGRQQMVLGKSRPSMDVEAALEAPKSKHKWMWWGSGSKKGVVAVPKIDDDDIIERRDTEEDDAIERYYLKHCLPTISQVVHRAGQVRNDWQRSHDTPLTKVLVLSNGWPSFLLALSNALEADGWTMVNPDEKIKQDIAAGHTDVGVAIDMALAQRAEVFLGNGFSSLSANIALFRMREQVKGERNRLL